MDKQYTQNNFLSYVIILAAFFVLLFFTKGFFNDLQIQQDTYETSTSELEDAEWELTRLNELKAQLSEDESEIMKEIQWFTWEYSDKAMVDYIYSYAQQVNLWDERIIIRKLNLSGESQSDLWFSKAQVDISAVISSEETLFAFLNYLTSSESSYRFYITNFSYDLWEETPTINIDIPLTLYYK